MTKRKKLTPEQKKKVWAMPTSNAGAGWHSSYVMDWRKYNER